MTALPLHQTPEQAARKAIRENGYLIAPKWGTDLWTMHTHVGIVGEHGTAEAAALDAAGRKPADQTTKADLHPNYIPTAAEQRRRDWDDKFGTD